jgi:hypothetical protein
MNKNISLLVIGLLMCVTNIVGQKKGVAPIWPGIPYSYVKVYLYNLDNQLLVHYQPVKNGKLDPTVVGDGQQLTEPQVAELLTIMNGDTRTLNEGLAKCYEPHHAFVFYDQNNKIVASFDVCFLCEGIRFYPAKNYYKEQTSYSPAIEKAARKQLAGVKAVIEKTEVPVLNTSDDYLAMAGKMAKQDTLTIQDDTLFLNLIRNFKNTNELAKAIDENVSVDSTLQQVASGDKVTFYFIKGATISVECMSYNGSGLWITKIHAAKNRTGLFWKVDVYDMKGEVYERIKRKSSSYPYEKVWQIIGGTEKICYSFDEQNRIGSIYYKSHY